MHRGFVKQWRKEIDSNVWQKPPLYTKFWLWLKMAADYKTGTLTTSYSQMAEAVSWVERGLPKKPNRKTIYKILEWFEGNSMVTVESNKQYTTITILNWDTYNGQDTDKVTANGQSKVTVGGQADGHSLRSIKNLKEEKELKPTPTTTEADLIGQNEKAGDAGSVGDGVFLLVKTINDQNGGTGIPVASQRSQLQALIGKWGLERLIDVAKEHAPAMDNKTWGYRMAVLKNNAEPKAPSVSCPVCGTRSGGCKKLRSLGNYRFYAKVANPTIQIPKWAGVPHFFCPVCSHRTRALPGEREQLLEERQKGEEKEQGRRGNMSSLGEEMKRLMDMNNPERRA